MLKWLYRLRDIEGEEQELFWQERMDFVEFIKNLKTLTENLPGEEASDEESEAEAGSEGETESSDEENESGLGNN